MSTRLVLVIALSLVPGALAEGIDVSAASLAATSQALDADGSYLPDPVDLVLCRLESSSNNQGLLDDGSCDPSGVPPYRPPAVVGPLDADRDDVPDAIEGVACSAAIPAAVGRCNGGDLAASTSRIASVQTSATGTGVAVYVDEDADAAADAGETTTAGCAGDVSSCRLATHGRLAQVCTSTDPVVLRGCLDDTDGDGRLLLQEIFGCSDPTDPLDSTPLPPGAPPTQCGILP